MATPRRSSRGVDQDAPPPDLDVTPNVVMGKGTEFQNFIWQQIGDVQRSLGAIVAKQESTVQLIERNQGAMEKRLEQLDSKVGVLNRIVWIGVGVVSVIAVLAGVLSPLVHFLIRVGIVTP